MERYNWTTNKVPHFGNDLQYETPEQREERWDREEYERLKERFEPED